MANGINQNTKVDNVEEQGLEIPNRTTVAAIEEGRRIAKDPTVKSFCSIDELRGALQEYYDMIEHPERYKRYSNFGDALKEVLADDQNMHN